MERKSFVVLEANGKQQSFELGHAERILKMTKNGGWKLSKDSKYLFDLKNGISLRDSKGDSKKSKEKTDNK